MITLKDKKSGARQDFQEELIRGIISDDLWMITASGHIFRLDLMIKLNYFPDCNLVSFLNESQIFPELYAE